MKCSITSKLKIWVIITLVAVVVGMVFLGVFGLNKGVDYKCSYEIQVNADQDIDGAALKVKDIAKDYFKEKGISAVSYAEQNIDDNTYVFKFVSKTEIDSADLSSELNTRLNNSAVVASAKVNEVVYKYNSQVKNIVLALAISAVVAFIYLCFTEKFASSLSVFVSSCISTVLFIALVSLFRIPAYPMFAVGVALTAILSMVLSTVMVNRFKEEGKNVANENKSAKELADVGAKNSLLRFMFIFFAILLGSILLAVFGRGYFLFIGLLLIVVDVSAVFVSLTWTPMIWTALKRNKK